MTNIPAPELKSKVNINKYRDLCRDLVNASELTPALKLVLVRLAYYVNSEDYTAWPDFDTLTADTGVGRATVARAINEGRRLGIIRRIYKGGKKNGRGTSNRYIFLLNNRTQYHPDTMSEEAANNKVSFTREHSIICELTQYHPETLSSNDPLRSYQPTLL
jgi:hypothetical protein